MANEEQLALIQQGTEVWNAWVANNMTIPIDLSGATIQDYNLQGANLVNANLTNTNLSRLLLGRANLRGANLQGANLSGTDLRQTDLSYTDLRGSNLEHALLSSANLENTNLSNARLSFARLEGANLSNAVITNAELIQTNLIRTDLTQTNFSNSNLTGAYLGGSHLVETNLTNANLSDCSVYGVSTWNLILDGTIQQNILITQPEQPPIRIDNIEAAQLIYTILDNRRMRQVLMSIITRGVLILGRFTPVRMQILNAIRDELRRREYLPIMFDFDNLRGRSTLETVTTLARLSAFVIADLTDPRSIPEELTAIVPNLPSVPIQPIILEGEQIWGMWDGISIHPWVLPIHRYENLENLLISFDDLITPAQTRIQEQLRLRNG